MACALFSNTHRQMESVVIKKLWIRPSNSEGNPLHVSFSREPENQTVRLLTIGLETSFDWHRDKQVREREQAGKTPGERAILIQTQHNIDKLKEQCPRVSSFDTDFPFGENFFVEDAHGDSGSSLLDPTKACIGDILEIVRDKRSEGEGERSEVVAILQISSPRWPCYKVNMKHSRNLPHLPAEEKVQAFCAWKGLGGVFCRIIQEGTVQLHDRIVLKERIHPQWTLARVSELFYGGVNRKNCLLDEFQGTEEELQQLLALQELAAFEWRDRLTLYLQKREQKKEEATQQSAEQPITQPKQIATRNSFFISKISFMLLAPAVLGLSYFLYQKRYL